MAIGEGMAPERESGNGKEGVFGSLLLGAFAGGAIKLFWPEYKFVSVAIFVFAALFLIVGIANCATAFRHQLTEKQAAMFRSGLWDHVLTTLSFLTVLVFF